MLKLVTIILLSISSSLAVAVPRYRGTPPKKCERILVSDEKQGEVTDLAHSIAELRGRLKLLKDIMSAPANLIRLEADETRLTDIDRQIGEMEAVLAEIRSHYTKSPTEVEIGITRLRKLLAQYKPDIEAGLKLARLEPRGAYPAGFMKREVFSAFPELADLPPGSISDELGGQQMGDQNPNPPQPMTPRPDRDQQQQALDIDLDTRFTRGGPPRMKP